MKRFKKILLIIVIVILVYFGLDIASQVVFKVNYGSSTATADDEVIGTVYLMASPVRSFAWDRLVGHSWILIENTSDEPFFLADTEVDPGQSISFGTTAMPGMDHRGIWVNVEGYNSNYLDNVATSGDFYDKDLEYLEVYLKHHDRWSLMYTCVSFATGIWNNISAGQGNEYHALFPEGLYRKIKKRDEYILNKDIDVCSYYKPYDKNSP